MMILKTHSLPVDIKKLGVEGVNMIWRDAKLRGVGLRRANILIVAAEHSVGSQEAVDSARMELKNLLNDFDLYQERGEELLKKIQIKLSKILYNDKVLEIK